MLTERMPQEKEHKSDSGYREAIKAREERLKYRESHMETYGARRGSSDTKKTTVTVGKKS